MFSSEAILVDSSLEMLRNEFNVNNSIIKIIKEPKGLFGVPDVLLYNGYIIAIEFKLRNWKQAIKQAYRYTSFSYESYVLLDKQYASNIKNHIDEFMRFNIGLGVVDEHSIEFYYKPKVKVPYSSELMSKALELFA